MAFWRSIKFARLICMLLAVQIANISVDIRDLPDIDQKEDLGYNECESVLELILENYLDISDAIPETDDADETSFCDIPIKVKVYQEELYLLPVTFIQSYTKPAHAELNLLYYDFFCGDILIPPPRLV